MLLSRNWGSAERFKVGCVSAAVTLTISRGLYIHVEGSNWTAFYFLLTTFALVVGLIANRLAALSEAGTQTSSSFRNSQRPRY